MTKTRSRELTAVEARHFRDELKAARAAVLADAEAYVLPLNAFERLGRYLRPTAFGMKKVEDALASVAAESGLVADGDERFHHLHRSFQALFTSVREARNDAMHVGARARHLTTHAVEVCLILEDALQTRLTTVGDFMVRDPVVAERWQPVSHVRHKMLENSFTFIPLAPEPTNGRWDLLADHHMARFLRVEWKERKKRLRMSVAEALETGLTCSPADVLAPEMPADEAVGRLGDQPVLVMDGPRLLGILTAFDLL